MAIKLTRTGNQASVDIITRAHDHTALTDLGPLATAALPFVPE